MTTSGNYLHFVLDQLSDLEDFTFKKMFGGIGFFKNGKMFGTIVKGAFRLKTDATTQKDFEAKGIKPDESSQNSVAISFWEVPTEVLHDKNQLKIWVEKAYQVANI